MAKDELVRQGEDYTQDQMMENATMGKEAYCKELTTSTNAKRVEKSSGHLIMYESEKVERMKVNVTVGDLSADMERLDVDSELAQETSQTS